MRNLVRLLGGTLVGLAAVGTLGIVPALADQQTTLTIFTGGPVTGPQTGSASAAAAGTWTRTIQDWTEPNGPGGGTIQATTPVGVAWSSGMTAAQVADAYRNACNATLAGPGTGANGYRAVSENSKNPTVRLSKQAGTYNFTDGAFPPGITVTTIVPSNAEHAPVASPVGLASLAMSLSALAYWVRRRRRFA